MIVHFLCPFAFAPHSRFVVFSSFFLPTRWRHRACECEYVCVRVGVCKVLTAWLSLLHASVPNVNIGASLPSSSCRMIRQDNINHIFLYIIFSHMHA